MPRAPQEIGVQHLADDRAGADERDFHHHVVEALGPHARQRRHLRARLDLEHTDGVGGAQHLIGQRVVGRQATVVDVDAFVALDQRHRFLQHRHHPETQQIDLHDAEIGAVVLVPLDNHPPRHARRLERHDLVEMIRRDHHAARVLAEVARQVDQRRRDLGQELGAAIGRGEAGLGDEGRERRAVVHDPARQVLGDARELLLGEAERAAGVAHRHARAIGDHVRGHGGAARAVLGVDVLDHLLAAIT